MKIIVGKNEWQIMVHGKGENLLLAFHGYGQNHLVFEHLSELMNETNCIWCIDLAFHGDNEKMNSKFLFDEEYVKELVDKIVETSGKSQIGLIGYSIGGRIALSITSLFPEKISEIFLLAPDGLPVSKTYLFLTHTWLGNVLFKRFVYQARIANFLLNLGKKIKLLSSKLADYYLFEIETFEKRKQLYSTWTAYKNAIPNKQKLLDWNRNGEVTCILGKHDRVITLKKTQENLKKVLPNSRVIILEAGHNLLSEKAIKKLSDFF